jgi:peptidoglycan/LPS O-acetylase OafA/YrhL
MFVKRDRKRSVLENRPRFDCPLLSIALLVALTLSLAACLSTQVESLAPNMVRLNIKGNDAPSDSTAIKDLLLLAAKETLARDYALFRFADMRAQSAGSLNAADGLRANFSVTVIMFHVGEQGANGVFDARQIIEANTPAPK